MDVNKLFYGLFFAGICLWQYPSIHWLMTIVRTRFSMHRNLSSLTNEEDLQHYGKIYLHLRLLIDGAEGRRIFPTVQGLIFISAALMFTGTVLLHFFLPTKMSVVGGLFLMVLPYLFLQVRLHEKRVERSKEGDVLVQELLNQYQIHDYNIQEALEKTAAYLDAAPLGKRLLLQLVKGLQQAVTKKEVEDVLLSFRYAFHTAWGNVLASNIFFAHLYGIRIDGSLKDLLSSMTQSRKAVEYGRRENHEAKLMLQYLAPASFLLSVFFACRYFDFTVKKFIQYQFGTELGMQWFLSMAFCYIISLMIHQFLAKEKMDL